MKLPAAYQMKLPAAYQLLMTNKRYGAVDHREMDV